MRALASVLLLSSTLIALTAYGQDSPTPRSQWDGIYTSAQADRGENLYGKHCGSCHGADLLGMPQAPQFAGQPDHTPPLVGSSFAFNWNDMSVRDLFDRIRISMPQNSPGSLTRQMNADILAFMFQRGGYPAGDRELTGGAGADPPRPSPLDAITFFASRP